MSVLFELANLSLYILYIILPLIILYIGYLILTKAFKNMGFSSGEAIIIVFASFILGSAIIDDYIGISFSNIYLFTYENWQVGINTGGAIIPIILSIYLVVKNKLRVSKITIGTVLVAVVTFFVTSPVADKGIVSYFPFFLLPAITASFTSVILSWDSFLKAAPLAYISGTLGVLIGADFLHLPSLLNFEIEGTKNAVIGGASVFDMVFITGILAVFMDGILMYRQRIRSKL